MTTGTYIGLYPSLETLKNLDEWAKHNSVILDAELHSTLLYSRKEVNFKPYPIVYYVGRPIRFISLYNADLVLELYSPVMKAQHKSFIDMGGTSDFSTYIPHITLATSFNRVFPTTPRFDIFFDIMYVEQLEI